MSISQKIDSKVRVFSNDMRDRSKKAAGWAKNLKMGTAVRNLITAPFYLIPWVIGRLFYFIKWLSGYVWFAFRNGAKME